MNRAAKGGQTDVNGEFYEGGKFLPRNPDRSKVEGSKPHKARKIEIEPFKWIEAPAGFAALFGMLDQRATYDRVANTFGGIEDAYIRQCRRMTLAEWEREERRILDLAAAYNRGERVIMAPAGA